MAITLTDDTRQPLIESIKRFFKERMDDEIGDLKAILLLDYFMEEIGPTIYNQAIIEARGYMQDKLSDMDGSCYEPEFNYWKK